MEDWIVANSPGAVPVRPSLVRNPQDKSFNGYTMYPAAIAKQSLRTGPKPVSKAFATCCLFFLVCAGFASRLAAEQLPMPDREFRGAWVATVANIDWPSKPGLSTKDQQNELDRIVQRAAELHLNALVFQVRPACDALYASALEPWSTYLTGTMGVGPQSPKYDPLEYLIQSAHRRGIEVHAWFNPYRALHPTHAGPIAEKHISKTLPETVHRYGEYLWMDPGHPMAAKRTLDVIADVVTRYDVDGVHFDDYFYPYPIQDEDGKEVPFPDDATYAAHGKGQSRDDWRRDNVNRLVQDVAATIRRLKPHVKFGISPFGIWRPGHPQTIKGFDAYAKLYADSKLWLNEGWIDYFTPQLYWTIESEGQSYPKLLDWWILENKEQRNIWPGNYASRVGMDGDRSWDESELVLQIEITRTAGATGNILFSMKSLFPDYGPLGDTLRRTVYLRPALAPPVGPEPKEPIMVTYRPIVEPHEDGHRLRIESQDMPWMWIVWTQHDGHWDYHLIPGSHLQPCNVGAGPRYAIAWVDRRGHMSKVEYHSIPR